MTTTKPTQLSHRKQLYDKHNYPKNLMSIQILRINSNYDSFLSTTPSTLCWIFVLNTPDGDATRCQDPSIPNYNYFSFPSLFYDALFSSSSRLLRLHPRKKGKEKKAFSNTCFRWLPPLKSSAVTSTRCWSAPRVSSSAINSLFNSFPIRFSIWP